MREAGLHVVAVDLQCFLEEIACVVVLMRVEIQKSPAHAGAHGFVVGLHGRAEQLIRATHVTQTPRPLRPAWRGSREEFSSFW